MAAFRSSVEPVLGTRLTMRLDAADQAVASRAEDAALAEADRLEAILSRYRDGSPFNAWRRGELAEPPAELVEVLALAAAWWVRTGGAFNPGLGALTQRWRNAADEQRLPHRDELAAMAAAAQSLPYTVAGGIVTRIADCRRVDVHAIAKGWVVDRMVAAAMTVDGVDGVLVDLGGDLRHAGAGSATVAVEDPLAVADNAAPLAVVRISDRAVAGSGGGRRGWRIAGRWYGHLLDPVTGWPLDHRRSATAIAATTADADAVASAAALVGADTVDALGAALVVGDDGTVARNEAWRANVSEVQ